MSAALSVSVEMAMSLQAALRGDAPRSVAADSAEEQAGVGAIWFGDWRDQKYGTDDSPVHNACISRRTEGSKRMTLAPITRKKHSAASSIFLPFGTIPGGQLDASYLLFRRKLRASMGYLREKKFKYKAQLPACYVQEMVSRMEKT